MSFPLLQPVYHKFKILSADNGLLRLQFHCPQFLLQILLQPGHIPAAVYDQTYLLMPLGLGAVPDVIGRQPLPYQRTLGEPASQKHNMPAIFSIQLSRVGHC